MIDMLKIVQIKEIVYGLTFFNQRIIV